MTEDVKAEIAGFARDLGLLREAVGTPSVERMQTVLKKNGFDAVSRGTLRNAEKGLIRPKLATVVQYVHACRLIAERDRLHIDSSRFDIPAWQDSWQTLRAAIEGVRTAGAGLEMVTELTAAAEVTPADGNLVPSSEGSWGASQSNWLWVPRLEQVSFLLIGSPALLGTLLEEQEFRNLQAGFALVAPSSKTTTIVDTPSRAQFVEALTAAAAAESDLLVVHLMIHSYLGPDLKLYSPCRDSDQADMVGTFAPLTTMLETLLRTFTAKALVLIVDTSLAAYAVPRAMFAEVQKPCAVVLASGEDQALAGPFGLTNALAQVMLEGQGASIGALPMVPMYELSMMTRKWMIAARNTILKPDRARRLQPPPLDIAFMSNHGADRIAWIRNPAYGP